MNKRARQVYDALDGCELPVRTRGGDWTASPYGLPSTVMIFGQHYRIAYHSKIFDTDNKPLSGIVMYDHKLIVLNAGLTRDQMVFVLYHEVAHVVLHSDRALCLSSKQEEGLCDLISNALTDLVRNNRLVT